MISIPNINNLKEKSQKNNCGIESLNVYCLSYNRESLNSSDLNSTVTVKSFGTVSPPLDLHMFGFYVTFHFKKVMSKCPLS